MSYIFIPTEKAKILIEKLKVIATDYYNKIQELERGNLISSFGIASDSDITVFSFHYNTQKGIEKIIEYNLKSRKGLTEENDAPLDEDKWSVYEWVSETDESYSLQQGKEYSEIYSLMDEQYKRSSWDFDDKKNTFAKYKRDMFYIFCEVLKELKDEHIFKNISEDFFIICQESDNGVYGDRKDSLKKILSPSNLVEYSKYWTSNY